MRRISVSLPEGVFRELDQMVAQRGLENRSKAIAEMISHIVLARREARGDPVMAGMIALVYEEDRGGLMQRLFELERKYRKEVISSLHVQLEENHRMEILIVQGPVRVLKEITDRILSCNGVISCKLTLTDIPATSCALSAGGRRTLLQVNGNMNCCKAKLRSASVRASKSQTQAELPPPGRGKRCLRSFTISLLQADDPSRQLAVEKYTHELKVPTRVIRPEIAPAA